MKLDEGKDVLNLPAYAVYKNLIPGVKVYQDTNTPSEKSSRRKKRKSLAEAASTPNQTPKPKPISNGNGVSNGKAATPTAKSKVDASPVTPKPSASLSLNQTPSPEGKKRKRKRKSNKNDASNLETDADTPKPAKTMKSSTTEPVLLPNPFAKKQKQQQQNGSSKTPVKLAPSTPITPTATTTTTNLHVSSSKKAKVVQKSNGNNSTPLPKNNNTNVVQQQNQKVKSSTIENGTPKKQDKKENKNKTSDNSSNDKAEQGNESNLQQKRISLTNVDKNNDSILDTSNQSKGNKKKKPKASKNKNGTQNGSLNISSPSDEANNTKSDLQPYGASFSDEEDSELGVEDEIPIELLLSSRHSEDSVEHGKYLFKWLISPTPIAKFMTENWEKSPLLIKREDKDYYKWLLTSSKLDTILRNNVIRFGKNIDITSYTDGQRETHNPVGRALPPTVWDYYSNGCSVRFLNPQTYNKALWRLNALLQEYFGTFVGANVYLTPPDSQGFAPHYDDIEAFILQVEGRKHWKVYKPRTENEELPRFSSANFNEETDNLGKPVLDVVLEEGDLLYFPRGYIHQAKAVDEHSLHITLSCYQQNSWGDLLKEHLSAAIDQAMASSVEFRKGLPLDYLSYMGIAHAESKDKAVLGRRREFMKHAKSLVQNLMNFTTPDHAADNMGKKFMWDSLPPYFVHGDKKASSFGDGEFMDDGKVYNRCELDPDVEVKLIRQNCVRLVFEENTLRLYFTLENSLEYHGEEPQFVEIPMEAADGIKKIISSYPDYVKIDDLPMPNVIDKVQVVADLWEKGIVVTKDELTVKIDDGSDDDMVDEDYIDIGDDDTGDEEDEEDSEYDEFDNDDLYDNDMSNFLVDDSGEEEDEDDDDDNDDFNDFMDDGGDSENDSEEDKHGLGKSFVEEIHSDDEIKGMKKGTEKKNLKTPTQSKKQTKSRKQPSASEDDEDDEDDIVPQLVPATPNSQPKQKQKQQVQDKTPKNKNKKNKKKKLNT